MTKAKARTAHKALKSKNTSRNVVLKTKTGSSEHPEIWTRIMFAVWMLTKDDVTQFVSRAEISAEIKRLYGDSVSLDYIRKKIRELQRSEEKDYDTFIVDGRRKHKSGKTEDLYRLHEDTVLFPETAWILLSLCEKAKFHRIPEEAVEGTKQEALRYGLSAEYVDGRISEALRVGYIKEIVGSGYVGSNRLSFEKEYLVKLTAIFRTLDVPSPNTSSESISEGKD
jgi:hypothetical protein